jgi:hypothetical protein
VPGKDGLEEPIIHVEVGIEPSERKTGNAKVIKGTVNVTFILFQIDIPAKRFKCRT